MKPKHIFASSLLLAAGLALASCSEDLNSPVLPDAGSVAVPEAQPLDGGRLFGVWEAQTSYGDNNQNYFEEQYRLDFSSVEDGEAVYSHWYTDAETGLRDSVCDVEYTYEFDGSTAVLTPTKAAAAGGASVLTATHTGGERMLLTTTLAGRTDSVCTIVRTGDPEPTFTGVDRTLPRPGEMVTVTGRNLQFVDHIYLPTADGEVEISDFTAGSREIKFTLPEADYAQGSMRLQSVSAGVNCYSPAYMFCENTVFFRNFNTFGAKSPYKGTEFEYSINAMGTLKDHASNLASDNLPEGHCLLQAAGVANPDSLLSFFGDTPVEWPLATKTDDKKGYLRFSCGDRFQYALDNSDGLFSGRTPCSRLAIQMDIYVVSDGVPEWNTGYLSWRLTKDQNSLTSSMLANVAGWERDAPMSFADGWRTFTIPLSAFSVTDGTGAYSTLGGLISQLKASNLQTLVTLVNYPLDDMHPVKALGSFQFCVANIRLVPYGTPGNTPIE